MGTTLTSLETSQHSHPITNIDFHEYFQNQQINCIIPYSVQALRLASIVFLKVKETQTHVNTQVSKEIRGFN